MFIRKVFIYLYLFVFLITATYQDFFLVNYVGEIARSGVIIFLPVFLIIEIIHLLKRKIVITILQKYMIYFTTFIFFVGVLYSLGLFFCGIYYKFDELLIIKVMKGVVYFILIILFIRHINFLFSKINNLRRINRVLYFVNVFLFIYLIVEYITLPNAFPFLHSDNEPYFRIRLLTRESSFSGTIWVVYILLSIYLSKYNSSLFRWLCFSTYFISSIIFIILSGSKGFLLVLILSLFLLILIKGFQNFNQFSLKRYFYTIVLLLSVLLIVALIGDNLIKSVNNDIQNYTSMATRVTSIVAAIKIILHNPLGVGLGNSVYFLPNELLNTASFVGELFIKYFNLSINFAEVYELTKSDYGLSIKSGIFQWLVYGGIVSIYLFYKIYCLTNKVARSNSILLFINIFVWLSLLTYIGLEIKYEIWLWFGFVDWYNNKNKEEEFL